MDLNKYLSSNGAPSVSELRQAMVALGYDVKSNAQIRQWRKAYQGRRPSPENCAGLEQVTKGVVTRGELRPTPSFVKDIFFNSLASGLTTYFANRLLF